MAHQIAAYVQRTGSLPVPDGQDGSEAGRLAGVLVVLRNQNRRGLPADEATHALDAAFPGWLDGITLNVDRHWQKRATELIEWVKENGRNPHRNAGNPTDEHWQVGSRDKECMRKSAATATASRS